MWDLDLTLSESVPFASLQSINLGRRPFFTPGRQTNWDSQANRSHERTFTHKMWQRAICSLGIFLGMVLTTSAATPAFVHGYYATPQTSQSTVTVTFAAAQTAGNLNVVVIGWNDATAQVTSVSDSKGNPYQLAGAPTVLS